MARYRYTTDDGPLLECPECKGDLTKIPGKFPPDIQGGISLEIAVNGIASEHQTCLDNEGFLIDTEDHAIAAGFHSETRCGHCHESLVFFEEEVTGTKFELDAKEIDWTLVVRQKSELQTLTAPGTALGKETTEALEGLIGLLDYVQDEAAKVLGEDAVFGRGYRESEDE